MRTIKVLFLLWGLFQLVACGGGGGGSSSNTPSTASSGTCAVASNCALPGSVAAVPPQN